MTEKKCPCGGKSYEKCCGKFLSGKEIAKTPEELMRSRYTAFALKDVLYIEKTMTGPAKNGFNALELQNSLKTQSFLGLTVLNSIQKENKGMVEFKAILTINGENYTLHEKSEFIREDGKWFYYEGITY